jgi:ketosteroid isomerase-like protein
MSSDVLAANQAFYDAFARRDLVAMERIWAREAPVACTHPGWDALHGREDVLESWRAIIEGGGSPDICCVRPRAVVLGDVAFVTCQEVVPGGRLIATNLFVKEDGRWLIAHHHAGPLGAVEAEEPRHPPDVSLN